MGDLWALHKNHKKTCLINGSGFAVSCVLKPYANIEGYELSGISHFTGVTFDDKGNGYFGDSFDLTLDVEDVAEKTTQVPVKGWFVQVTFPQFKNAVVDFHIENVAIDRTLGVYLLTCSASAESGTGKRFDRQNTGGI